MALWKARTLDALHRVFKFEAGETLRQRMDLEAPVQPVLDVGRMAELGTGVGDEAGFFLAEVHQAAAGSSNYYTEIELYDLLTTLGYLDVERDYRIWIMNLGMALDAGDMDKVTKWAVSVTLDRTRQRLLSAGIDPVFPLAGGFGQPTLGAYPMSDAYDGTGYEMLGELSVDGEGKCFTTPLPMFVPPAARLATGITTTAALGGDGWTVWAQCWAGVKGASPPGLS